MHEEFGRDQHRQCNQETDVRLDVVQGGDLDGSAQSTSLKR
jgi:hypothetical protein